MLSQHTLLTVKSTAPLLAEKGRQITDLFYRKLFSHHPELQHIFNMANQQKGEQSKALADSVFMYATHIEQISQLVPMVTRIAHKHASLGIRPDHYPIVGKHLLAAIQETFELEDQHEILNAWAEAYGVLASIMIQTEEDIYCKNEKKHGGWRGFRNFVIHDIVRESDDIKSFYLKPEDNQAIADFSAGQYIGVKLIGQTDEYDEIRQYSLSHAPSSEYYRITVKAENSHDGFVGKVSNKLHSCHIGDILPIQAPTGEFTMNPQSKHVALIAGGVGITPLLSMLHSRIAANDHVNDIVFIHCCKDKKQHIMQETLTTLSQQHGFKYYVAYETESGADHTGYLNTDILSQWVPIESDVYFCGPKPFMAAVNQALLELNFTSDKLHYETFGPSIRL